MNDNRNKNKNKDEKATEPQSQIWQEILREANTNKDLEDSHLFIFGDKNVGKKAIIKIINKEYLTKNDYEG